MIDIFSLNQNATYQLNPKIDLDLIFAFGLLGFFQSFFLRILNTMSFFENSWTDFNVLSPIDLFGY